MNGLYFLGESEGVKKVWEYGSKSLKPCALRLLLLKDSPAPAI